MLYHRGLATSVLYCLTLLAVLYAVELLARANASMVPAPTTGNSSASSARKTQLSEEEQLRKQAVLAQFAYEEEDEDDDEDGAIYPLVHIWCIVSW